MGIRKFIADILELQHDVALNLPVIHLTGGERLLVENHRGLQDYTQTHVRIASTAGAIDIEGDDLSVKVVGHDDILLTGSIKSVMFNKTGVASH